MHSVTADNVINSGFAEKLVFDYEFINKSNCLGGIFID
jgi:hypothetical protein